MITAPNGTELVKWAVSDDGGVKLEMSQDETTIRSIVPNEDWITAATATTNTGNFKSFPKGFEALIGCPKHTDSPTLFTYLRVTRADKFDSDKLTIVAMFFALQMAVAGIEPNQDILSIMRGN